MSKPSCLTDCLWPRKDSSDLLFPAECAGLVRIDGDLHAEGVLREKFLDVLRPLHDAEAAAVEVVVKADLDCLLEFVDAIEVEMIHWVTIGTHIFVYDGKCRRTDRICNSKHLAQCSCECCLA